LDALIVFFTFYALVSNSSLVQVNKLVILVIRQVKHS
jgi:hypothetical protein